MEIAYAQPYRFRELIAFFKTRALEGVERVGEATYERVVSLRDRDGRGAEGWIRVEDDPNQSALVVTLSPGLAPATPAIEARLRRQFDVERDPHEVHAGLAPMEAVIAGGARLGTRLPGCFDPFETACRAVIGQQITVRAANRIAARIAARLGRRIADAPEGLNRVWPKSWEVAAIGDIETTLGECGVVRTRSRAIATIAEGVADGTLDLSGEADPDEQVERLLAIKGIGPWTARYIAMRVLGHRDVFLETDSGVAHALPDRSPKERVRLAEQWRPWRSYAVINLWNSLTDDA